MKETMKDVNIINKNYLDSSYGLNRVLQKKIHWSSDLWYLRMLLSLEIGFVQRAAANLDLHYDA